HPFAERGIGQVEGLGDGVDRKRNRCMCSDLHGGKVLMPVGLSRLASACDTLHKPYCYAIGCGAELPSEPDLRSPPFVTLGSSSTRMIRISTVICYASIGHSLPCRNGKVFEEERDETKKAGYA